MSYNSQGSHWAPTIYLIVYRLTYCLDTIVSVNAKAGRHSIGYCTLNVLSDEAETTREFQKPLTTDQPTCSHSVSFMASFRRSETQKGVDEGESLDISHS